MGSRESTVRDVAVFMTGWFVTDDEARRAWEMLSALDDHDFLRACESLARHSWHDGALRNHVKTLIENLDGFRRHQLLLRILRAASPGALEAVSSSDATPYATYVRGLHARVRRAGLGREGALRLVDTMISGGEFGRSFRVEYQERFGTDNARGWDKAMHFVKAARIAYFGGALDARILSYGKEVYDQLEHLVGLDPEGYSQADIKADEEGISWGLALRREP